MNAKQLIKEISSPADQGVKQVRLIDSLEENLYPLEILHGYLMYLGNEAVTEGGILLSPEEVDRIGYTVGKFINDIRDAVDEAKPRLISRKAGRVCTK